MKIKEDTIKKDTCNKPKSNKFANQEGIANRSTRWVSNFDSQMLGVTDHLLQPSLAIITAPSNLSPVQLKTFLLELQFQVQPPTTLIISKPDDRAAGADLKKGIKTQ